MLKQQIYSVRASNSRPNLAMVSYQHSTFTLLHIALPVHSDYCFLRRGLVRFPLPCKIEHAKQGSSASQKGHCSPRVARSHRVRLGVYCVAYCTWPKSHKKHQRDDGSRWNRNTVLGELLLSYFTHHWPASIRRIWFSDQLTLVTVLNSVWVGVYLSLALVEHWTSSLFSPAPTTKKKLTTP